MAETATARYALVTGAASGLGSAFAARLVREGWQIAAADIQFESQTLPQEPELILHLDVTSPDSWKALGEQLRQHWPRIDLLINNAGICGSGAVGSGAWCDSLAVLEVNLKGVMLGCHTLVPWMKEAAPGGHIVNVASVAAYLGAPSMSAYNASKAGVVAYSETLAAELKELGVGVTVVLPGFFPTQLLTRGVFAEPVHRQIAEELASKSKFTADDVVEATLAAVRRRDLYVVIGRRARWLWRLKRAMPRKFVHAIASRYQEKLRKYQEDS